MQHLYRSAIATMLVVIGLLVTPKDGIVAGILLAVCWLIAIFSANVKERP